LMRDVRRTLAENHPLGLLALVSSLLAALDPRARSPFDRRDDADLGHVSREELVRSFIEADRPETSALLAALAAMANDELLRARARRELDARANDLPDWLHGLDKVEAYRAVEMVHVLGDGDDVIVGTACLPARSFRSSYTSTTTSA